MTWQVSESKAKLGLGGTLVYHDKDGNEVGNAHFFLPLDKLFEEEEEKGLATPEGEAK